MGFLNSWQLWSGLAAAGVAVPIVIHLLYRKHRQQTDWAAMELLRRALVVRSGQVKIEDYLILFLRCLALLLVAMALLRPTFESETSDWISEERVGMVVAIDASLSMNHGEFSRFERAINKAKEILATAGQGEPVSLVLMSNRPQILLRRKAYDQSEVEKLLDEQKNATPYRLSLEPNLEQLEELVDELNTATRECYVITDAQEQDWRGLSAGARRTFARLTNKANVYVTPIEVEPGDEDNLSVTKFAFTSGPLQQFGTARFEAEVRNEGRHATDGGNVEFYVGDDLVKRQAVGLIEAGKTMPVAFLASFAKPGNAVLSARLAKDDMNEDNERHAVVNIRPSIRALCVDDEPPGASRDARTGAYYAVRAMRLLGRGTDAPVHVSHIQAPDLSLEKLSDYDIMLLANVTDLAPEMVDRIHGFVSRGGGLIMFLGNRVDAELYNKRFAKLLPAVLGDTIEAADGQYGWALGSIESKHSLAAIVERSPSELADSARFTKLYDVTPAVDSQTILTVSENDAPLLLSRDVGTGSVLMFTTSADRTWNQLPIHPFYAMLLQQAVTILSSHPETRQTIVGQSAELPVRGRQVGDRVQVKDPQGNDTDVKVTLAGELPICSFDTQQVGVYEIAADGDAPAVAVAANIDAAESNVRVVNADELASELEPDGVRVIAASEAVAGRIKDGRRGRELARFLLICGICVFVAQGLLAKYYTNRMSNPDADVSASLQRSRVSAARRS